MTRETTDANVGYEDIRSDFDHALQLRDAGEMAEAESILARLAEQRPDVAAIHLMLGHVQEELGNLSDAAVSYRLATEFAPGKELPSISLFHALRKVGDLDGAVDEVRRFRSEGSSPEYDRLIDDLNSESPEE